MSDVSSIIPRAFTERSRSSGYQLYIKMTKKSALFANNWWHSLFCLWTKWNQRSSPLPPIIVSRSMIYLNISKFETFWMETTSIDLWNVFELKTRTNNNAEDNHCCTSPSRHSNIVLLGWHNRFAHRIDKKHPNIRHFIRVLQEEEVRFNQYVQHVWVGKKKVYGKRTCRMHECLETLATRFKKQQIDLTDYIQGLSLLVAKKKWFEPQLQRSSLLGTVS